MNCRSGGGFSSPMDMFNMFFGGGGRMGGGGQASNKSKPIVHKLGVTLEELYNGKTRKLAVTRCDAQPGLPEGLFSKQKFQFGQIYRARPTLENVLYFMAI
jgi:hypothetical protein